MTALRSVAFYLALYAWTAVLGIATLPALALPRRAMVRVARAWSAGVLGLLAATVGLGHRVAGRGNLPAGPVIVAAKHQSAWETFALELLFDDPAVVLKRSLLRIPIYGWYLWRIGMIPIERSEGAAALRAMIQAARRAAAERRPIVVFPEGTRTAPGKRLPYHPGVYALYRALGLPVVPVALNSGLFWPRRRLVKRPGTITVEFLPPIAPGLDRDAFMAELERRIETATDRLTTETQRHREED